MFINNQIECFDNSDCGTDGFIDEMFCSEEDVMQTFETFTCNLPGTGASSCSSETEDLLIET